jgi:glycosyltransferase involved in cell wall biosynthesis
MRILFLGEILRADAQSWIKGIESNSHSKITTIEIQQTNHRVLRFIYAFKLCIKLIIEDKYDIVLAERITSYGFLSLFVKSKIKIVAQQGITDVYPDSIFSNLFKSLIAKTVIKHVDLIHAWGNAMVPALVDLGAQPDKILVLAKGLDLNLYTFANQLAQQPLPLKAIVTRSLEKDYQHWNIIDAVAILNNQGIHLEVDLVGSGSLAEMLKNRAHEKNVSHLVNFLGRIPNDELPTLLAQCPIYLSVPATEGVSSSLFEAMASGCFPIVTDLPGNRAFIKPKQNGDLVPVNNAHALANAIAAFSSNPSQFVEAIIENRKFIDDNANRTNNMKVFWAKYEELMASKN